MKPLRSTASMTQVCLLLFLASFVRAGSQENHPGLVTHQINAKIQPAAIQFASPHNFEVIQRHSKSEGIVRVQFESLAPIPAGSTQALTADLRLIGNGEDRWWRNVPAKTNRSWDIALRMSAGGWYRLEAHVYSQENLLAEGSVDHVGIGEVFVVSGQSNSANHGEELQSSTTGQVSTATENGWQLCKDPQPGASGQGGSFMPPLGDLLAQQWKVPIGFVATGVGATSVREWLPQGSTFPNPPTLEGNVTRNNAGEWESKGTLFKRLSGRIQQLGPHGFRAVLWHQGESDANQSDSSRTFPGHLYQSKLQELIQGTRSQAGWDCPWMVALVSYHTPTDTGSEEIRNAQKAICTQLKALIQGPDSDALVGDLRDGGGKGVHFSGKGLRELASQWNQKLTPWLTDQLKQPAPASLLANTLAGSGPPPLRLPRNNFQVHGRPAFMLLPEASLRSHPQPWIFYAPTLPGGPDEAERWMHSQFLRAGIAIAGVDVGEAYGSPSSHAAFDALFAELTQKHGFAPKACFLGRSRGGLWVSSYAIAHPDRVSGIVGIYPVYDFQTYPGIAAAAPAYGLTPKELESRSPELNPISRASVLAQAGIPFALIHGDIDKVVPLPQNSMAMSKAYEAAGKQTLLQLIVLSHQGHNYFEGFFRSQELVDFGIVKAREGAGLKP